MTTQVIFLISAINLVYCLLIAVGLVYSFSLGRRRIRQYDNLIKAGQMRLIKSHMDNKVLLSEIGKKCDVLLTIHQHTKNIDVTKQNYDHAASLVALGVSKEEVMSRCRLSQSETELIQTVAAQHPQTQVVE